MRYLIIGILFLQIACSSSAQERQVKTERKLFQKSSVEIKSPTTYSKRETEKGEYDPRPRVVLIDEKAGRYELRWIGYDGKQKIVKYQRADALDALVEARIEKTSEAKFTYIYTIKNLSQSPNYLSRFIVQTFGKDAKPVENENIFIGDMSKSINDFKDGLWWMYSVHSGYSPQVIPGKSIEFKLISSALPGIVGCRATAGDLTLKGAGEHMPSELEDVLPGYAVWARCYTVGPIDRLATLNKSEKVKYILENLPKFQEVGWMSAGTAKIYKSILAKEDLTGTLVQAKKDLENEFITGEVFYIIEGLNQ
ncbi:MAG: hypothetical protein ACR2MG_21205 [Pyrinomonadaceae bacterium]